MKNSVAASCGIQRVNQLAKCATSPPTPSPLTERGRRSGGEVVGDADLRKQMLEIAPDSLPEAYPYRDQGCDLYPSCLACPLPACRYDQPRWSQRQSLRGRNRAILKAYREGQGVQALARSFGLSRRTIHRILRRSDHG